MADHTFEANTGYPSIVTPSDPHAAGPSAPPVVEYGSGSTYLNFNSPTMIALQVHSTPSDPPAVGPSAPPVAEYGSGSSYLNSYSPTTIAVLVRGTLVDRLTFRGKIVKEIWNNTGANDIEKTMDHLAGLDVWLRSRVADEYRRLYDVDIRRDLNSALRGRYLKKAVVLWMSDPLLRDVDYLKKGLSSSNDSDILIEVMVTRSYSYMQALEHIFSSVEGALLRNAMEAKGYFGQLLYAYASTHHEQSFIIEREMLKDDARSLYLANRKKPGYDEGVYVEIFSRRSSEYLLRLRSIYFEIYMKPLEKEIKMTTNGPFKEALLTILRCSHNRAEYFAEVLHKAITGLFPDHETLARVVVTRADADLEQIKREYQNKSKKTLSAAVKKMSLLSSKTFLLRIIDRGPV